ncbi:hypothetical protein CPB86DRAFT_126964 [Serendipita vermifera]|nr:hypothetical protein CPB86DRAFT_126964 [Serendipita vermifera]
MFPTILPLLGLSGRGALIGVVVGGLLLGCLLLILGLWLCYRRRGSRSGSSSPRYTIPVSHDEKPRFLPAFLLNGFKKTRSWKKNHTRVRSSLSFASPMIDDNEPKMIEKTPSQTPLAPHLGGSSAVRDTWATFTSSDGSGSMYPQTPVGTTRLSGIIMETVVETDAQSDPHAPTMISRHPPDYLSLRRPDTENKPELTPVRTNRLSAFREEDESATPTTPTSSGGLTYGSIGHGSERRFTKSSERVYQQPPLPVHAVYQNDSNPFLSGHNSTALLATRPKFNPTHSNGSGTISIDRESGDTIRITNPFLDDEDASSYGHGIVESEGGDRQSMLSTNSSAFAYPSSAGCIPKPTPSPNPDAPINRPRSSLISDASSDYPYPLGYAMDADGNVANPFLRISEILEEVDGRMRWPSPPLLPRTESRNY